MSELRDGTVVSSASPALGPGRGRRAAWTGAITASLLLLLTIGAALLALIATGAAAPNALVPASALVTWGLPAVRALHHLGLLLPLRVGHVDDVEQQVRVLQLLQRGLEGLYQLVGQLADESHRVGDHHVQGVADRQEAAGGVQGVKEPVVGGDARPGEAV